MSTPKKSRTGTAVLIAILQIVGSAVIAVMFGAGSITAAFFQNSSPGLLFCAGIVWSVTLFVTGLRTIILCDRSRKATKITERAGDRITVAQLANALGRPKEKLLEELGEILARNLMADAKMDLERSELVLADAPKPVAKPEGETVLREKKRRSRMTIPLAAATALTFAGVLPMSVTLNVTLMLAATVIVFFGALMLLPASARYVEAARTVPKAEPVNTGNSDVDTLLNTAMEQMTKLSELDREITDPSIDKQVQQLTKTAWEIINHIKEHPEKARQIRQFLNYYLPTTIKLISEYNDFTHQNVITDNIRQSMAKIEDILGNITGAFQRELDNLYIDKAVDISAEIDVMRGMIQREGLGAADITKP